MSVVVAWQYIGESISEYVAFTFDRLQAAIAAIQLGLVSGSEASRARSATMMFEYWASQDWIRMLVGEGYANYEGWLEQTFPHVGEGLESSFARGSVHSVFSAVGISTGIVGLFLYLGLIGTVTLRKTASLPLALMALWIVYHFAMGYLIDYKLWWPIIFGVLIFRTQGETSLVRQQKEV